MPNRRLMRMTGAGAIVLAWAAAHGLARGADEPKWNRAVRAIQSWKYGDNADGQKFVAGEVVRAARDAAGRKAIEKRLIDALAGATTRGARDFFCRQLVFVGSEAAVAPLAKLLGDPESSHMARYALARLPGKGPEQAMLKALPAANDKLKVGMIYSLGRRGCREAVDAIAPLVGSKNTDLAVAALVALSRIDSDEAVAAIAKAHSTVAPTLRDAANDAYLDCATRLATAGKASQATAIFEKLFASGEPTMCRIAALNGLIASAKSDRAMAVALAALADKDAKVREAAAPALRDVPGSAATKALAAELGKQDKTVQPILLMVLADRKDSAALPAVVKAAGSDAVGVRLAAIQALGAIGKASTVPLLAGKATGEGAEAKAARTSLEQLLGDDIDPAIVKLLGSGDAKVRSEAVRSLAARGASDCIDAVIQAVGDTDAGVAAEALKALRTLAGPKQLPTLVSFLAKVSDAKVRAEAENAVVAAAKKMPPTARPATAPLAAYKKTDQPAVQASLIRVMGRIGHDDALDCLRAAAQSPRADVKDAGIRALAGWPTAEPIAVLRGIAEDTSAPAAHRVIALRGFIGMIQKQSDVSDEQVLADHAKAIALASRTQEKQLVLSKLASLRDRGALAMARQYTKDPALKGAADAAVRKIEKLLAAPATVTASHNPNNAKNAVDGDPKTRWDTGSAMAGGEWFRVELDEAKLLTAVVLDAKDSRNDYPRGYEVYVCKGRLGQGKLVAKGKGTGSVTTIRFPKPVVGKSIKIVQTGQTSGLFWSIHELTVESKPAGK